MASPYDFIAGRMSQVHVTDRRGGERLDRYLWQADDVIVADRGYGYRRSVALAVRQHADVVVRIAPAPFPLETEAGAPFNVLRWLRHRGGAEREWHGWCRWEGPRYRVRLVAAKLDAQAVHAARRRARRKAQKAGHTLTAPTLTVAGWVLLITTLDAGTWTAADVLYVYRARWQVELVFKKMKQLLRLNQIRTTAPYQCRSDRAGAADWLGIARRHHDAAADAAQRHGPACHDGGEQLAAERAGAGHATAASARHVVGGPPPGGPLPLAAVFVQPPTASGTSGDNCTRLARTTSPCTPR